MKQMKEPKSKDKFNVVLIGVIYNPAQKKILIHRKDGDPELGKKYTWGFPGTELKHGDNFDRILIEKIKEKTGYIVKNLGAIFSKVYPENKKLLAIYFLCEAYGGKLKLGKYYKELKWVNPEELEKYFTTSFHSRLQEYIMNLK